MTFTKANAQAAGRKGGRATKRKYGLKYFVTTGRKGAKVRYAKKSNIREGR